MDLSNAHSLSALSAPAAGTMTNDGHSLSATAAKFVSRVLTPADPGILLVVRFAGYFTPRRRSALARAHKGRAVRFLRTQVQHAWVRGGSEAGKYATLSQGHLRLHRANGRL